ncbi:MAG TPA: DUF624 domain-containing protein [Clostridiales bacterium]|nr:DUF624 domain-containing protein [Clostridiales bacterium]
MGNFFSIDNKFFTIMSKLADIMLISILYTVICIPIITIGPANTAIYYATVKVIRRDRGYLFREFFRSFRLNFKKGAIIGVVWTILITILGFDLIWSWISAKENVNYGSIFLGVFIAITVLLISFSIYVFPILSRFDMTIKQLVKAAFYMSIRHLASTVSMLVLTVVCIYAVLNFSVLLFIIPGILTLVNSLLMERIFKKYMPQPEDNEDETKDQWYLE